MPSKCFDTADTMYDEEKIVTYFAPSTEVRKIYPPPSSKALLTLQNQWGKKILKKTMSH